MQRLAGMGGWGRVSRGRLPPSPPDPFFAVRPEIVDVSAGLSASRLGVRPGAGLSASEQEFHGPEAGSSVPGARGPAPGQDPALESEIPALGLCGWVSGLGFPLREQLGFPPPPHTPSPPMWLLPKDSGAAPFPKPSGNSGVHAHAGAPMPAPPAMSAGTVMPKSRINEEGDIV